MKLYHVIAQLFTLALKTFSPAQDVFCNLSSQFMLIRTLETLHHHILASTFDLLQNLLLAVDL
jgi:hypothetical protein